MCLPPWQRKVFLTGDKNSPINHLSASSDPHLPEHLCVNTTTSRQFHPRNAVCLYLQILDMDATNKRQMTNGRLKLAIWQESNKRLSPILD